MGELRYWPILFFLYTSELHMLLFFPALLRSELTKKLCKFKEYDMVI